MPSVIRYGANDLMLPRSMLPRVSTLASPSSGAFDPLTLSPVLWLAADNASNTLSTTGYAGSGTVTQVGTAITGVSASFLGEVKVGDVLSGTLISGAVVSIADATHLTVDVSNSGAGASYTITPVAGISDRLSTWKDKSGNGKDFTNGTAKLRPAKIPNIQGVFPAILADGVNDTLSSASLVLGSTASVPYTVMIVMNVIDNSRKGTFFALSEPGGGYSFSIGANGNPDATGNTIVVTRNSVGDLSTAQTVGTGTMLLEFTATSAATPAHLIYKNASQIFSGNFGGNGSTSGAVSNIFCQQITTTRLSSHYALEILVWNTVLSSTDRASMESYLNTKYAIY